MIYTKGLTKFGTEFFSPVKEPKKHRYRMTVSDKPKYSLVHIKLKQSLGEKDLSTLSWDQKNLPFQCQQLSHLNGLEGEK